MSMEILQRQSDRGDVPAEVVTGDLVRVREGLWRVMEVRTFARSPPVRTRVLKLIGADTVNRWQPCTLLEPFDRPRRVEAARAPRVVSRARWMRTCAALIAASPPAGCPATIADAQVTLMPHQIDPVLAVLRGRASRLLLADAVGLGKTIQAALLLRELRARGCADRVLILVPSGLREQWRQELSHRTGLRADIIDAAALAARTRELPPDVNPWSLPGILIVSLDFIKQPSVLRGASTIVWDILIADEAHNLNEGTGRLAAADLLARHSRHVVLLTATPHHGSDDAFATLCRIGHLDYIGHLDHIDHPDRIGHHAHIGGSDDGAPSGRTQHVGEARGTHPAERIGIDARADAHAGGPDADPIAIFRRTRQTMGLARTRKVHVLRVTPTKQERRLHTLLARYAGRVERECGSFDGARGEAEVPAATHARAGISASIHPSGEAARHSQSHAATLAMSILLKRASSSAWSLERSLRRRLALLDGRALPAPDDQPRTQPVLPFVDDGDHDDYVSDGEPSHVLGAPGLRSARIERAWLTLLIEASRNASRAESKPRALARFLRRCREPALIYTEYRDTLTHLARTLPDSSSQAMLHGGLGADDRRTALARFASGDARILLTTDAAGEGLNLHQRCRLVINVELPWNPNRLEQRIGRVDRLGQSRTVHALHLVAAGTAEEPMLTRLAGRIAQIAATLGDAPAVLRAARESVSSNSGMTAEADTQTAAIRANAPGALRAPSEFVSSNADMTTEASALTTADGRRGSYRAVSTAAACVTAQLQRLRAMRARAWRIGRRRHDGTHASRGDPLLALDERAPLIAVARLSDAHELPAPGLICIWRTRVECDDGQARGLARPPSSVLTATHIACDVPHFTKYRAVVAFVASTIERCRERIKPLLDGELAAARRRIDATDRTRIERLARRDDAIAAEMAAMLRARASSSGMLQPLLFEDIAIEKTTVTGANDECCRTWTRVPPDADAQADADASADVDAAADGSRRSASTLSMVLVLR